MIPIFNTTGKWTMKHSQPPAGDGIQLDGYCRFGRISNLKGATNDDLVAINADDNENESPCFGPIEDISIDGLYAEGCHSAVRILSSGSDPQQLSDGIPLDRRHLRLRDFSDDPRHSWLETPRRTRQLRGAAA